MRSWKCWCWWRWHSTLRTVVNLHMFSLHYYDYGRRENFNVRRPECSASQPTHAASASWMLKHLIHEIRKRIWNIWCAESEVFQDDVSLNLLTSSIYSLFGRQKEFFAESMFSYSECKEIAFAFTFVNRKCNFLLFRDDTIAQNAHHSVACVLWQSRSHVNVSTKLKSTMNWWDNPVEISMHKWKCRHARPFTGWTRLNVRDKLCNPLVANRTDTCSRAHYSSTSVRIRYFSIHRPHTHAAFVDTMGRKNSGKRRVLEGKLVFTIPRDLSLRSEP